MRKQNVLLLVMTLVVALGCSSSGSTRSENVAKQRDKDTVTNKNNVGRDLAYYLQQVPGVIVSGSGNNVDVNIRGSASFMASTSPLFVIDGQPVGNNYSNVNSMINVNDIDYVRVLKGSEAAAYGVRGGNGVIEIFTKKD
ncbi:MAG TPA: TonB-dependent receptor plug domain-containing protein [Balneolaceae bacterium]|nr:TonB-dependent receptor plug domain-containing protein [Balneolaceae bacterium]